ncbi:MAG TPA: glycosyltransferase family 4 protein [Myxococcota bacterium]|jgi:glycosyltransferase involved in cell wall biosynthesis|nr:glycosyltransferase family 4 protein [Myxococcota bacterium]
MSIPTRPLNVLWLIDHVCWDGSLHGGGRLFYNLLPEFDPARVRPFPYFLRASDEVRRVFADAPVKVTVLDKGKYDPTAALDVARLCRRHAIDVMHLFCYASSTFGRLAGATLGIPTVIHDFDTQIYFPYPLYLKLADRLLAPTTGRAIAASPLCRRYMRDVRRIPSDRIELMPHAVPEEKFAPAGSREEARAELGFERDAVVFCAVTKLGPDRGNETLLRAFARLHAERPSTRLVIVYKPTYYHRVPEEYAGIAWIRDTAYMREEIRKLAVELGVGGAVELVESLDQPDLYLRASDVCVVPFEDERFSSVHLLESCARGLPAIATDLGEQREMIVHERSGLLVPPGDEAALAAAMRRLADDSALRARLGAGAAARAREFRVGAVAERLADLYASLAAGRTSGAPPPREPAC